MPSEKGIRAGKAFVEVFADNTKLVRGLRMASAKLKAFGKDVSQIGMRVTLLATAAVIPLSLATKTFAGFDDQMRATKAVTGATGKEFENLTQQAKYLGRTTSYTAAQVAAAMLELGRAGFDTSEIGAGIDDVLAMARATGTDLPLAANIAANTLRQFGLAASDAGRVADVMTATANNSAQTLEDLGQAMTYAAPVAAEFGMTLEDTAKAMGAMANFGIRGSMAGTSLRMILTNMTDPGIQKRLAGLGVAATDSQGRLRGLADIMRDIAAATQNMPNSQRLALFKEIFGQRALAGGSKLTAANFEKLNDAIENATGTAAKAAADMDSGIGGVLRRLWSAVEGVTIAIGEGLAPSLSSMGESLAGAAGWVTKLIEKNRGFLVGALKVIAATLGVGVSLTILGTAINGFGTAVGLAVGLVGKFIGLVKLVGVVLAGVVSPLGLVIGGLAAFGTYLVATTDAGGKALTWLGGKFSQLSEHASKAIAGIGDALAAGDIGLAAKILWLSLKVAWLDGTAELRRAWQDYVHDFSRGWENLKHMGLTTWYDLIAGLRKAWAEFTNWHQQTTESLANWFAKMWVDVAYADRSFEERGFMKQHIDQQTDNRKNDLQREHEANRRAIDSERDTALETEDERHKTAMNNIDAEADQRRKTAEENLRDALKERDAALEAARKTRLEGMVEDGGPAGAPKPPGMPSLEDIQAGVDAFKHQAARTSLAQTTSTAALDRMGIGAGSTFGTLQKTIAEQTKKTVEEVRKMNEKLEEIAVFGGPTFA